MKNYTGNIARFCKQNTWIRFEFQITGDILLEIYPTSTWDRFIFKIAVLKILTYLNIFYCQYLGHIYVKIIICMKFKFNWTASVFSDNLTTAFLCTVFTAFLPANPQFFQKKKFLKVRQ